MFENDVINACEKYSGSPFLKLYEYQAKANLYINGALAFWIEKRFEYLDKIKECSSIGQRWINSGCPDLFEVDFLEVVSWNAKDACDRYFKSLSIRELSVIKSGDKDEFFKKDIDNFICNYLEYRVIDGIVSKHQGLISINENKGKPSKEPINKLETACGGVESKQYQQIREWFISKGLCDPKTFRWKGGFSYVLVNYLKELHTKGYADNKLSINDIMAIAKNSFYCEISINTVKSSKSEKFHIVFFLQTYDTEKRYLSKNQNIVYTKYTKVYKVFLFYWIIYLSGLKCSIFSKLFLGLPLFGVVFLYHKRN